MSANEGWRCAACGHMVATRFCPLCGESALRPRDLTLRGILDQAIEAFTSVDRPLLRSLRGLVTRPGFLTVAYMTGQRKPYTRPLQLFLIANVLFFAAQFSIGARVFSMPLVTHLNGQIWSAAARHMVEGRLQSKQMTIEQYAPLFDQAVALNAKSLIVLMVVPFALLPALLFYRRKRPFLTHLVFALHFYAFVLLLFCCALAAVGVSLVLGGRGLDSEEFDHVLSLIEVGVCAVYLYFAAGRVYGGKTAARLISIVPLVVAAGGIVLGYRFSLFLITLYST